MNKFVLSEPTFEEDVHRLRRRLTLAALFLASLFVVGVIGYKLLDPEVPWLDALYMTVISLTTVGYGEFVEPTPAVRSFTMALLVIGMVSAGYFVTTATAFVLEGSLGHVVWRRRMMKEIASYEGHHIVCGSDETALYATRELISVQLKCVLVCETAEASDTLRKELPQIPVFTADPTDDDALIAAGI